MSDPIVERVRVYLDVPVDWEAVERIIGDAYHTVAGRGR